MQNFLKDEVVDGLDEPFGIGVEGEYMLFVPFMEGDMEEGKMKDELTEIIELATSARAGAYFDAVFDRILELARGLLQTWVSTEDTDEGLGMAAKGTLAGMGLAAGDAQEEECEEPLLYALAGRVASLEYVVGPLKGTVEKLEHVVDGVNALEKRVHILEKLLVDRLEKADEETEVDVTHPNFGATGDGTTDDTVAITDAITAAAEKVNKERKAQC